MEPSPRLAADAVGRACVRVLTRGTDTPYEMQARDGNLWLSPSDVTTFLGCEHATTLSVRAARGELEVPAARNERGAS